jgi:DNA processing protein
MEAMSNSTEARRARAFLQHAAEPTNPILARYVAKVGPVEAAHHVAARTAPTEVLGQCRSVASWRLADTSLQAVADLSGRFVIPEDDEWPAEVLAGLRALAGDGETAYEAPLGLWVAGGPRLDDLASARSVAIVGARAATEHGEYQAAEFAYALASRHVTVFSGAAYGIDGAAHGGALATGQPASTVAVLACGLDVGYPAGHMELLKCIARSGAIVSEYPPGVPPARQRFLQRYRLLSAFTTATVVVEAGQRSGACYAARLATKLGRPVLAAPGAPASAMSAGCRQLIQNGTARLVESADDIVAVIDEVQVVETGPEAGSRPSEAR